MSNRPKQYAWLWDEPGPRILTALRNVYGIGEVPGPGNDPSIMAWAKQAQLDKVYTADAIPWCGLAVAYAALEGGFDIPNGPLWARNWAKFGNPVKDDDESLGDVLVFARGGAGHVGLYVGEDATHYHVLGGNQSDAVNIRRIPKARMLAVRRCPWRVSQPPNVRKIMLEASGVSSAKED